jgi:hypothetical protein
MHTLDHSMEQGTASPHSIRTAPTNPLPGGSP